MTKRVFSEEGKMIGSFRSHIICKIIALTVCFTFISQSIVPIGEARAQATRPAAPLGALLADSKLVIASINIPVRLGEVTSSFKGSLGTTIIHIRDAHCDYSAQQSISGIIEYFRKTNGVDLVALEGGSGDYDLSVFTDIKDKELREKVADYFVREGEVNGAEYYAINNPESVTLYGIEDPALYMENLKAYRDSLKFKDDADKCISSITQAVRVLKEKLSSKELIALDEKARQFKSGKLDFKDYSLAISEFAKERNINLHEYKNIELFFSVMEDEKKLNLKESERDRNILIDMLNKTLSKKYLEELVVNTVAFNDGNMAPDAYYGYLFDKAELCGIELGNMPNLIKYAACIKRSKGIDKKALSKEFKTLEEKVFDSLFTSPDQKELYALDNRLFILKGIFSVDLDKESWDYYSSHKDKFSAKNLTQFVSSQVKVNCDTERLDGYRERMEKFYSLSLKRDDAFIDNMTKKIKKEKADNIILVTGGFHQDNLKNIFAEKGYSYIEILPKMDKQDGSCQYFKLLSGGSDPITRAILEKQPALKPRHSEEPLGKTQGDEESNLQIASHLTSLASEAYPKDSSIAFDTAVAIVAKIVSTDQPVYAQVNGKNIEFTLESGAKVITGDIKGIEFIDLKALYKPGLVSNPGLGEAVTSTSGVGTVASAVAAKPILNPGLGMDVFYKYFGNDAEDTLKFLNISPAGISNYLQRPPVTKGSKIVFEHILRVTDEGGVQREIIFYTKNYKTIAPPFDDALTREEKVTSIANGARIGPRAKLVTRDNGVKVLVTTKAEGKCLADDMRFKDKDEAERFISALGYSVGLLHKLGYTHGDIGMGDLSGPPHKLHTEHVYWLNDQNRVEFIDFGAGKEINTQNIKRENELVMRGLKIVEGFEELFTSTEIETKFIDGYESGKSAAARSPATEGSPEAIRGKQGPGSSVGRVEGQPQVVPTVGVTEIREKAPDVGSITRNYNCIVVHGLKPFVRPDFNSLLVEDADWVTKLKIVLAFSPTVSASTIKKGDSLYNMWSRLGVILKGGSVIKAGRGDIGTMARGLYFRGEPDANIAEAVKDAITHRQQNDYNDLNINNPEIAGLYYYRTREVDSAIMRKDYIPEEDMIVVAEQMGIPIFLIDGGEFFVREYDKSTRRLAPPRPITPEEIVKTNFQLPEEQRISITQELLNNPPFDFYYMESSPRLQLESSYVDAFYGGRGAYIEVSFLTDTGKIAREIPEYEGSSEPSEVAKKLKPVATIVGRNAIMQYYLYKRKSTGPESTKTPYLERRVISKRTEKDFPKRCLSFGNEHDRPYYEVALYSSAAGFVIKKPADSKDFFENMTKVITQYREGLENISSISHRKKIIDLITLISFYLYGFAEEAARYGDNETRDRAFSLASQIVPYEEYKAIMNRRGKEEGEFRVTMDELLGKESTPEAPPAPSVGLGAGSANPILNPGLGMNIPDPIASVARSLATEESPEAIRGKQGPGPSVGRIEGQQGLCVAGDTLLTLKDGQRIPIVKIRPNDHVMSLNEFTRKIEPHRVIGLLDMGVKPAYKLSTALGRSIKTTANHPYLTRKGWVKVSGLKHGNEIAVPGAGIKSGYLLTRKSFSSRMNNFLLKPEDRGISRSRLFNADTSLDTDGGCILSRIMPQYLWGGYISILEKWTSLVINILLSTTVSLITWPFFIPEGTRLTSCPSEARYSDTSKPIFSSTKNFISGTNGESCVFFAFNQLRREVKSRLNMGLRKGRIAFGNLLDAFSRFEKFEDKVYHDTSSLKTRLTVADFGIGRDIILDSHIYVPLCKLLYHALSGMSRLGLESAGRVEGQPETQPPATASQVMPPGMGGVGFDIDTFREAFAKREAKEIALDELLSRIGGFEGILFGLSITGKPGDSKIDEILDKISIISELNETQRVELKKTGEKFVGAAEVKQALKTNLEKALAMRAYGVSGQEQKGYRLLLTIVKSLSRLIKFPSYSPLSGWIITPRTIVSTIVITITIFMARLNFMKSEATSVASNIFPQSSSVFDIALLLPSESIFILLLSIAFTIFVVNGLIYFYSQPLPSVEVQAPSAPARSPAAEGSPKAIRGKQGPGPSAGRVEGQPQTPKASESGVILNARIPFLWTIVLVVAGYFMGLPGMLAGIGLVLDFGVPAIRELIKFTRAYGVDASAGNVAQSLPKQGLQGKSHSKLSALSSQSSSLGSFEGHTNTDTTTENNNVITKAIFHDMAAFMKASEINSAITRAWNRFINALDTNRFLLSVQNIAFIIKLRLSQLFSGVKANTKESPEAIRGKQGILPSVGRVERQPEAQPSDVGLCVAGDTLLTLKDGRQIPIIQISPGDYVMSLNESTRKIEPHRVIGLLDMGVKPAYKLSTTLGKSIKTIANHPYLTRMGWVKVNGLKVDEEIAVPAEDNINVLSRRFERKGLVPLIKRDSKTIKNVFLPKQIEISAQMSGKTYAGVERSMSDLDGQPKDDLVLHNRWLNSSVPGTGKYKGIDLEYFLRAFSTASSPVNTSPRHITNFWWGYFFTNLSKLFFTNASLSNVFIFILVYPLSLQLYHALSGMSRLGLESAGSAAWADEITDGDILWDRIVYIEYIGKEHVYDIEVEGTHNFIGNNIFAHNTVYSRAASAPVPVVPSSASPVAARSPELAEGQREAVKEYFDMGGEVEFGAGAAQWQYVDRNGKASLVPTDHIMQNESKVLAIRATDGHFTIFAGGTGSSIGQSQSPAPEQTKSPIGLDNITEGDYVEIITKKGERIYGVYDGTFEGNIYLIDESFSPDEIAKISKAPEEMLNSRLRYNGDILFGHGTNAYVLWKAISGSNSQLRPGEELDEIALTGESGGNTKLNRKLVSTIMLNTATSSVDAAWTYAGLSSGAFRLTLDNIDRKIAKEEESLKAWKAYVGDSKNAISMTRSAERRLEHIKKAKVLLSQLKERGLYEEYVELSAIPVCIVGEGVARGSHGRTDIANEEVFKRINIRVVGADKKDVDRIKELLKKLNITDILVLSYEELEDLANSYKKSEMGKEKDSELAKMIIAAPALAAQPETKTPIAQSLLVNLFGNIFERKLGGRYPRLARLARAMDFLLKIAGFSFLATPIHEGGHSFFTNEESTRRIFYGETYSPRGPPNRYGGIIFNLIAAIIFGGVSLYSLLVNPSLSIPTIIGFIVSIANFAAAFAEIVGKPFGLGDLAKAQIGVQRAAPEELAIPTRVGEKESLGIIGSIISHLPIMALLNAAFLIFFHILYTISLWHLPELGLGMLMLNSNIILLASPLRDAKQSSEPSLYGLGRGAINLASYAAMLFIYLAYPAMNFFWAQFLPAASSTLLISILIGMPIIYGVSAWYIVRAFNSYLNGRMRGFSISMRMLLIGMLLLSPALAPRIDKYISENEIKISLPKETEAREARIKKLFAASTEEFNAHGISNNWYTLRAYVAQCAKDGYKESVEYFWYHLIAHLDNDAMPSQMAYGLALEMSPTLHILDAGDANRVKSRLAFIFNAFPLYAEPPYKEWFKDGNNTLTVNIILGREGVNKLLWSQERNALGVVFWSEGYEREQRKAENGAQFIYTKKIGDKKVVVHIATSEEETIKEAMDGPAQVVVFMGHGGHAIAKSYGAHPGPHENYKGKVIMAFGCGTRSANGELSLRFHGAQNVCTFNIDTPVGLSSVFFPLINGFTQQMSWKDMRGFLLSRRMLLPPMARVGNFAMPDDEGQYEMVGRNIPKFNPNIYMENGVGLRMGEVDANDPILGILFALEKTADYSTLEDNLGIPLSRWEVKNRIEKLISHFAGKDKNPYIIYKEIVNYNKFITAMQINGFSEVPRDRVEMLQNRLRETGFELDNGGWIVVSDDILIKAREAEHKWYKYFRSIINEKEILKFGGESKHFPNESQVSHGDQVTTPAQSLLVNLFGSISERKLGGRYSKLALWGDRLLKALFVLATPFHELGHIIAAWWKDISVSWNGWSFITGNVGLGRAPPSVMQAGIVGNLIVGIMGISAFIVAIQYPSTSTFWPAIIISVITAVNLMSAITELAGESYGLGDLVKTPLVRYLETEGNNPVDILKTVAISRGVSAKGEHLDKIILEIGCGEAKFAAVLAKNDKAAGVIATDIYDPRSKSIYGMYAKKWMRGKLRSAAPNIIDVRSSSDILKDMEDDSVDCILLINPEPKAVEELFVLLKDPAVKIKLKEGAQVIIKPTALFESLIRYIGDEFKFDDPAAQINISGHDYTWRDIAPFTGFNYSPSDKFSVWRNTATAVTVSVAVPSDTALQAAQPASAFAINGMQPNASADMPAAPSIIKGAMHEGEKRLNALVRLVRRYGVDFENWIEEQEAMTAEETGALRAALLKTGLDRRLVEGVISKIILVTLPSRIRPEGRGPNASRIGGVITGTRDGLRILFPKDRLMAEPMTRESMGDLLHEAVELILIDRFDVDEAHWQATRVRDAWMKGAREGAIKVLNEVLDQHIFGKFELGFKDAVRGALKSSNIATENLESLNDKSFSNFRKEFLNRLEAKGWNASPDAKERFARLLTTFISKNKAIEYRDGRGHFDVQDLILIIQRIHTVITNMHRISKTEETIRGLGLLDLIYSMRASNAQQFLILERLGIAGDRWTKTLPDEGTLLDEGTLEKLREGNVAGVVNSLLGAHELKDILPEIKGVCEFFGIEPSEMEYDFISTIVIRALEMEMNEFAERFDTATANRLSLRVARHFFRDGILRLLTAHNMLLRRGIKIDKFIARGFDGSVFIANGPGDKKVIVKISVVRKSRSADNVIESLNIISKIAQSSRHFALAIKPTFKVKVPPQYPVHIVEINEFVEGVRLDNLILRRNIWNNKALKGYMDASVQVLETHKTLIDNNLVDTDAANTINNFIIERDGTAKLVDYGHVETKDEVTEEAWASVLRAHKRNMVLRIAQILSGQKWNSLDGQNRNLFIEVFVQRFGKEKQGVGEQVFEMLSRELDSPDVELQPLIIRLQTLRGAETSNAISAPIVRPSQLREVRAGAHEVTSEPGTEMITTATKPISSPVLGIVAFIGMSILLQRSASASMIGGVAQNISSNILHVISANLPWIGVAIAGVAIIVLAIRWIFAKRNALFGADTLAMGPEESEAREFILSKPDIAKAIKPFRYLTELYGYTPWKKLYDYSGNSVQILFDDGLLELRNTFTKNELKTYWPDIVSLGIASGENVNLLFEYGLPSLKHLINSKEDLGNIGRDFLKVLPLCAGVERQTFNALHSLKNLLAMYPKSWDNFIKPIIFNQTQGAFLCFQTIYEIYQLNGIQSEEDLSFLRRFIESHGISAYDLLTNLILDGLRKGVMAQPISQEASQIEEYLSRCPYPIVEIYKAYKSNTKNFDTLIQRCKTIHQKIIEGDASSVEKDPLFSAMLMFVFPPAITTQREQYLNLYKQRPDRPQDTGSILMDLQGREYSVSTGRYALKDASKPLDESAWRLILEIAKEANKEERVSLTDSDISSLGQDIIDNWQMGNLHNVRKDILTRLYRYYRYSRGQTLPDSLGSINNIMAYKQFIGDTLSDLVTECVQAYQKNYQTEYEAALNKMFKTKIENPRGASQAVLSICNRFRDNPAEAKTNIGRALRIEDTDVLDNIFDQIWDKNNVNDIAKILNAIEFKLQQGKENIVICQVLQGSEYKSMQAEVSNKYEFNVSEEKIRLKLTVSKRKAHGVVGLNMGVCVAPDDKLWNNPNFMNVIIWDDKDVAQGGMHILIIEDDGKRYLTLPGINPSVSLLSHVNSEDIYNHLLSYAAELAKELKCDGALIPHSASIHSNRSEIQRIISAKNYEKITLTKIHKFSYKPEYSFHDCFVVRNPTPPVAVQPETTIANPTPKPGPGINPIVGAMHEDVTAQPASAFAINGMQPNASAGERVAPAAVQPPASSIITATFEPGTEMALQSVYKSILASILAISIAGTIKYTGFKPQAFSAIVEALASLGNNDRAVKIFDQAISAANTIEDIGLKSQTLSAIAKALASLGNNDRVAKIFDQAISIASTIEDADDKSRALSAIAEALAGSGKIDQAISVVNSIEVTYDKFRALSTIAEALAGSGKIDQAISVVNSIEVTYDKFRALSTIAEALAGSGKIDQAISVAHTIEAIGLKSQTLSAIAKALASLGNNDRAAKIFGQAIFIANTIKSPSVKSEAISAIAKALASLGNNDRAAKIFDQAISIASTIEDADDKSRALSAIAEALAGSGKIDQAISVVNSIEVTYDKSRALSAIAEALAGSGKIDQAISVVNSIEVTYDKFRALSAIAKALASLGNNDRAAKIFGQAIFIANTIKSPSVKSEAISSIVKALIGLNKINEIMINEANTEIEALLDTLTEITSNNRETLAHALLILLFNGFTLNEIKAENAWKRFVRFASQSGGNFVNNLLFLNDLNRENAETLFDDLNLYFNSLELSLYMPQTYSRFRQLKGEDRASFVRSYKTYYAALAKGLEPAEEGLYKEIIEEIHMSCVGSTNLTQDAYRSTLDRFKSERIPSSNFNTTFTINAISGELGLSGITEEEEIFVKDRLKHIKGIADRAPPDLLAEMLSALYTTYLKADLNTLPLSLAQLIMGMKSELSILSELSTERVNVENLKQSIKRHLDSLEKAPDYALIFKDIAAQNTYHPKSAPAEKQVKSALNNMIALTFILNPHLKTRLDALSLGQPLSVNAILTLNEILSEIKPEAVSSLRAAIDKVSGNIRLSSIIRKRVRTEAGEGLIRLELIPAKTKLDYFYGYFGENCTSNNPEELLNHAFTPIRIVKKGKIVGSIHTLTLTIDGKKSLVICGIEPDSPLTNKLDAPAFVKDLLNKLTNDVAVNNGYEQVLISTSDATLSNRTNISNAIKVLIKGKDDVHQTVQSNFPANTSYSIKDLKLWAKSDKKPLPVPAVAQPPTTETPIPGPALGIVRQVATVSKEKGREEVAIGAGAGFSSYGAVAEKIRSLETIQSAGNVQNAVFRGKEYRIIVAGAYPTGENGKDVTMNGSIGTFNTAFEGEDKSAGALLKRAGLAKEVTHTIGIEQAKKEITKLKSETLGKQFISFTISAYLLKKLEEDAFAKGFDGGVEKFLRDKTVLQIITDYKEEAGKATVYMMPYFNATNMGLARLGVVERLGAGKDAREAIDLFCKAIGALSNIPESDVESLVKELIAAAGDNQLDFFKDYIFRIAIPQITRVDLKELEGTLNAMVEVWRAL